MDPHKSARDREEGDGVMQAEGTPPRVISIERHEIVAYDHGGGTTTVPRREYFARFPGLPHAGHGGTEEEAVLALAHLLGDALQTERKRYGELRERIADALERRR